MLPTAGCGEAFAVKDSWLDMAVSLKRNVRVLCLLQFYSSTKAGRTFSKHSKREQRDGNGAQYDLL